MIYLDKETYEKYVKELEVLTKKLAVSGDKYIKKDIDNLCKIINSAKVISNEEKNPNVIYIGDKVSVAFDMGDGEEEIEKYTLVIGNPKSEGEVSIASPVGEAILQRNVNEVRKCTVNGFSFRVRIVGKDAVSVQEDSSVSER